MLCYKKYFKHICRLAVFSVLFSFQSCSKSKKINYAEILNKELPLTKASDKIPFSTILHHTPTIRYKLNGVELFMGVDTGAGENILLDSKSVQNLFKKDLASNEVFTLSKKVKYAKLFCNYDNESFLMDPNGIFSTGMKKNNFDGLLGLPYLQKSRNVVFDYINNTMSFNEEPICDNSLPMYLHQDGRYYTTIECNGVKTNALIDTGNYCVFINKNNAKRAIEENETVNIRLGNVEINNPFIDSIKNLITNEKNKNTTCKYENVLGYPIFKDHVIQLDFEHNAFRIK